MNSSIIIRLPGFAVPAEDSQTPQTPAAPLVVDSAVSDEALMAQICDGQQGSAGHPVPSLRPSGADGGDAYSA